MADAEHEYAIVMTTTDEPAEADSLARRLVEERLAACVQVTGVTSTYRWERAVTTADERLLLIKTRADQVAAVRDFLAEHHSYDTPEVIEVPITSGLPDYLGWIDESVG
jgi:periplasmic divalent cation tolerance protein